MKISVIIVSYHAAGFLEQTLFSLIKATGNHNVEIIVSDNSSDNEIENLITSRFSGVRYIYNENNPGYAKANNRGYQLSTGELILFLNPDTIVPEDFFDKILSFFQSHAQIGAAGVKMIDGGGNFLPESKRNIPGLWNSFTKSTGLSYVFPRSKIFSGYYRNDILEDANGEIEVLSGACFFVRKEVLIKTGGFDERFFMYAEDIDLSYRILKEGYKIFYLGDISIIHFKGESSKKDKTYFSRFYGAMDLFVEKHYPPVAAFFLKLSIKIRAGFSGIKITQKPKDFQNKLNYKFIGDVDSAEEARKILNNERNNSGETNVIVLCEGKNFSFKDLIDKMIENPGQKFLIHAKSSASVAGSFDKNTQGLVFPVKT